MAGVNKEVLANLRNRFEEAMREVESLSNVDTQIAELQERHDQNTEKLKYYERQIPQLKQQIADLTLLRTSMQNSCIKKY